MSEWTAEETEQAITLLRILIREGHFLPTRHRGTLQRVRRRIEHERVITKESAVKITRIMNLFHKRGYKFHIGVEDKLRQIASMVGIDESIDSFKKELSQQIKEGKKKGEGINIVFMFGSGASRPSPSNIPTVNEMLDHLVENLPPTEVPFVSKVKEWATRNGINIEDILTAGYLATLLVSKPIVNKLVGEIIYRELGEQVGELREREYVFSFQDLVSRVFSMVSGFMAKADSNVIHESVAKLIRDFENDETLEFSVVTTNYDVCIEKAFRKIGVPYRYLGIDGGKGIPIVKIHGSINWFYCEGCQAVITYSIEELKTFTKIFPTSGSCQKCGTPASLFMVPPIAYKYVMFPPLIDIWQAGMSTLGKADVIIVIGYSFSLADDYIFKMMVSSIKKKKTLLAMLDRNAGAIRSLQDKLSAYHLKLPCPINGNAAETVPKITKSIWEAKKEATKEKSTKTAKKVKKSKR